MPPPRKEYAPVDDVPLIANEPHERIHGFLRGLITDGDALVRIGKPTAKCKALAVVGGNDFRAVSREPNSLPVFIRHGEHLSRRIAEFLLHIGEVMRKKLPVFLL